MKRNHKVRCGNDNVRRKLKIGKEWRLGKYKKKKGKEIMRKSNEKKRMRSLNNENTRMRGINRTKKK